MATTTRRKTLCSTCQKAAGILTCRGCGKDFCYRHVGEHRQELSKQIEEVTTSHDQFKQIITEQEAQLNCHPLMKKIDEWEHQSIDKIHQAADDARKELSTVLSTRRNKVTNDLTHLTQELNKRRDENDYVETDLKGWIAKLDQLKKDLNAAETINFGQENNGNALISKVFINGVSADIFGQTVGDIQIIENDRVVVHGPTPQLAVVRGRSEYSSGQHRFRFQMEQWSGNGDFSCGIVSKNTSMESLLYASSNTNMYGYGYHTLGAITGHNNNNLFYFTDLNNQKNDIIELLMDCDRQVIRLKNERIQSEQQLNVNLTQCPFPWKFLIILLYANDRVRLLEERSSNN